MSEQQKIHVAVWSHSYGEDIRAFKDADGPERWRQEIADEWWEYEIGDDVPEPSDPEEKADTYFERVESEFFTSEVVPLED